MSNHLWLIGMMGSAKSAVRSRLALRLGRTHYDTDTEVASRTGCSIAELWGEQGEAAFRSMEAAAIDRLADADAAVISTGGGAVLNEHNVAQMRKSGFVVWLSAPPEVLARRVGDGTKRPLLDGEPTEADASVPAPHSKFHPVPTRPVFAPRRPWSSPAQSRSTPSLVTGACPRW